MAGSCDTSLTSGAAPARTCPPLRNLPTRLALPVITLCDSQGLAYTVISGLLTAADNSTAEQNDRSVRNSADRPVGGRTGAQVSDVPGDKKCPASGH